MNRMNVLVNEQYGFRSNCSTEMRLTYY